jgi:hypothetical protein
VEINAGGPSWFCDALCTSVVHIWSANVDLAFAPASLIASATLASFTQQTCPK